MGLNYNLPCTIADVVDLLDIPVIRNTGTQLHCRCPFCDDKKAHLNVKLNANVFRCNRCGKGGGVLHLYAEVQNVSLNTAYSELCELFKDGVPPKVEKKLASRKQIMAQPELSIASAEVRNNTYANLMSLLSLGSSHRESLLKRGLPVEEIERLGYKTTPAVRAPKIVTELLERGCDLKGVPGFYCDEKSGRWKLDIRGSGIMIPDRNSKGEIEAVQIRLDKVFKSKFNNLTSAGKYYGATASCCPHFAGVRESTETVFLTEGIMKSDVARYLSRKLGHDYAFVGLTGVGNTNQLLRALTELGAMGVRKIRLAFDMDDDVNQHVREAKEKALALGASYGFEMIPLTWDRKWKGIDDLLYGFIERKD